MALSSLWEHLTPAPNYELLQGNQFKTRLRTTPPFFLYIYIYKLIEKCGLELLSAVGIQRILGEFFWQSPGNARSSVGTRGDCWEALLERIHGSAWGVLPHPSRIFQMGATDLKCPPITVEVPLKLTGTVKKKQLCLLLCPGGGFCSAECLANLTSVWKAANNLTKVFSAFFYVQFMLH